MDTPINNLNSAPAVLEMQISITRKDTGKVEHYTVLGALTEEDLAKAKAAGVQEKKE